MTKQTINVGTSPNDNRGDSLRASFQKINANFTELYTALGLDVAPLNLGAFEFVGSVLSTTDSSAIVIDQATTVTSDLTVGGDVLPSVANGGDLGSLTRPWKSLYVSNSTVYLGGTPLSLDPNTNELKINNVPVSQTITYTDIPNVPTDVSDLTDNTGLLGGGGGSSLVNGANTVSLGSTGVLTFPNGLLKIAGNKIRNVNESVGLIAGSEIEVTVDKTVISNGLTDTEGLSTQHIFEVGSTRVFSALQVVNSLGEGGPSLTGQQLTELTSTGFQIGYRVINDPGEGEPLTSFDGWTFGTTGNLTFPQGTLLGYSDPGGFIINGAVDKDIAIYTYNGADAHGWTFGTDGSLTLPGDIRSEGNINIDINLTDSTLRRWRFGEDGDLTLPAGGDILDSNGDSVLGGGSYTPDDADNWDSPTVNTVAAALDELAARMTAFENFEIDGGNAYTPAFGELLIDGNGA